MSYTLYIHIPSSKDLVTLDQFQGKTLGIAIRTNKQRSESRCFRVDFGKKDPMFGMLWDPWWHDFNGRNVDVGF